MAQRTIKLTIEYDGTDYVGWQLQENGRSVQEVLERGLAQILRENIRIVGAGRTDAGVHARGQVASFRMESSLHCHQLLRSLNGVLPEDVVVVGAEEVAADFNARYSARSRRYQYIIRRRPTALDRKFCWELGYKLDVDLLSRCAGIIAGAQDFESFCKSEARVDHYRCTVFDALWSSPDSATLVFDISADRFLHGMVRALVGTMVEIGRGYRSIDELPAILNAKDRRRAGMAAPARGLFLFEVKY